MNRWRIPEWLERAVIERDSCCVYCGVKFNAEFTPRRVRPSWEHIVNDASIITLENIARCCVNCNASKGTKNLAEWLASAYCKRRGIDRESVAVVIKEALHAGSVAAAPNQRVNASVRPVTPRACARVAPGRPARYAQR
jgi:hypothetical protein